jgi:hypothetical protein
VPLWLEPLPLYDDPVPLPPLPLPLLVPLPEPWLLPWAPNVRAPEIEIISNNVLLDFLNVVFIVLNFSY